MRKATLNDVELLLELMREFYAESNYELDLKTRPTPLKRFSRMKTLDMSSSSNSRDKTLVMRSSLTNLPWNTVA